MKQIYNPYLPSFEYVPDGEPHVFGDRVYLFGSHDRFNGARFCLNDYVAWSAPVNDITSWRYEGVIFRKDQDPRNQNIPFDAPAQTAHRTVTAHDPECLNAPGTQEMWAPDVVKGPDGRYYLYYCLSDSEGIGVAVCAEPAGSYEFIGFVHYKDGTVLGFREGDMPVFDPGIFVDDDGEIYLYSGNSPRTLHPGQIKRHSQVMTLENDMLTLKTEPRDLIPGIFESKGTAYEGHEFFEASSIRRINGKYYFVYSSVRSHELNYCVSDRPDGDYVYGGTLVDIGDVFLDGRTEEGAVNAFGNTHGGLECVNGQWYVFYHRQTNRTNFSRQACAEKVTIEADGSIRQAEVTSCGLNPGALKGTGIYPAYIACHVTRNGRNVMSVPSDMGCDYPYFTQDLPDFDPTDALTEADRQMPVQYLRNLRKGAKAGFKYFEGGAVHASIEIRGIGNGTVTVTDGETALGSFVVSACTDWSSFGGYIKPTDRPHPLYFEFDIEGALDMRRVILR